MRKYFSIALGLFLVLFLVSPAFAAVELQDEGTPLEGTAGKIDITGDAVASGIGYDKTIDIGQGARTISVISTTGAKTVTAAEDGTIFVFATFDIAYATLPDAVAGLYYTFINQGPGTGSFDTIKPLNVDVATTDDTIVYLALDAGDMITSPGATGDSVTLIGAANTWYITEMGDTAWTDGG